jgi:hypothetical protein
MDSTRANQYWTVGAQDYSHGRRWNRCPAWSGRIGSSDRSVGRSLSAAGSEPSSGSDQYADAFASGLTDSGNLDHAAAHADAHSNRDSNPSPHADGG